MKIGSLIVVIIAILIGFGAVYYFPKPDESKKPSTAGPGQSVTITATDVDLNKDNILV